MEIFLGNKMANNYETLVTNLLSAFRDQGCNMNVELHFIYCHLDRFPENLKVVSDEQGERFPQDLKTMAERYHGRFDKHYCWNIKRDCL